MRHFLWSVSLTNISFVCRVADVDLEGGNAGSAESKWAVENVLGDGNCLYYCFQHELKLEKTPLALRESVCQQVLHDRELHKFLEDNETPMEWIAKTLGGRWGGGLELKVLSEEYGIRLHVLDATQRFDLFGPADGNPLSALFAHVNSGTHWLRVSKIASDGSRIHMPEILTPEDQASIKAAIEEFQFDDACQTAVQMIEDATWAKKLQGT